MDHRAENETSELNQLKAKAHQFVGGRFSPEMELPKLKWVKKHLPETWKKTRHVFDLADYLSFKATSVKARSVCTLVCKWGWLAEINDWEDDFLRDFGLEDLKSKTEGVVKLPGEAIGNISEEFSVATGLSRTVSVSASLIDAHSGALGVLQASVESDAATRLALIAGTSNCHMMLIPDCRFVRGVWGPYESAIIPGEFLLEGGQTSAGSTIDWLLNLTKSSFDDLQSKAQDLSQLTDVLCIPDFHGNRSPLANPLIKGSFHNIAIHTTAEELFLSLIQGLALGTKLIIERIESESCIIIDELVLTGGLARSKLFQRVHADVTGKPVIVVDTDNGVLLGAAMLGASANGAFETLKAAQNAMSPRGSLVEPDFTLQEFYSEKFEKYKRALTTQF